jgi:hypothetical protein
VFTNLGRICLKAICCDLNPAHNALGNVLDKNIGVFSIPFAGLITDDEPFTAGEGQKGVLIAYGLASKKRTVKAESFS